MEDWDNNRRPIFDVILAANYLDIKPLLDLGCKTLANLVKGKNPEEIRAVFGVHEDFRCVSLIGVCV